MKLAIDRQLAQTIPNLALGVIHYVNVTPSESPNMLKGRINLYVESMRLDYEQTTLADIEGVKAWRSLFKRVGTDPSRYRPSSEALLRRLLQGNPFFWVNTAVDVNNFLSIQTVLPYGIYDMQKLTGDIVCRIGTADDRYQALNGREVDMNNKLLLADEQGAFGSPYVDSIRSSVTEAATELLQVIFFHDQLSVEKQQQILGTSKRMFTEINGGDAVFAEIVRAEAGS